MLRISESRLRSHSCGNSSSTVKQNRRVSLLGVSDWKLAGERSLGRTHSSNGELMSFLLRVGRRRPLVPGNSELQNFDCIAGLSTSGWWLTSHLPGNRDQFLEENGHCVRWILWPHIPLNSTPSSGSTPKISKYFPVWIRQLSYTVT